jgi:hypothetical protein
VGSGATVPGAIDGGAVADRDVAVGDKDDGAPSPDGLVAGTVTIGVGAASAWLVVAAADGGVGRVM